MTLHPTKPGQRCRLIGSWSLDTEGKQGPNHGKEVTTVFLHQIQANDCVPVWRVRGENLTTSFGGVGNECDALNYWLEVLPPNETPPEDTVAKKELETS